MSNAAPGTQLSRDTRYPPNPAQSVSNASGPVAAQFRVYSGTVLYSLDGHALVVDVDANTDEKRDFTAFQLTSSSAPVTLVGGDAIEALRFINSGTTTVLGSCEMQQVLPPTSGTFTLTVTSHGLTTSALAFNCSTASLKAALAAIVGTDNVFVDGPDEGPWDVYFVNALANTNLSLMTSDNAVVAAGYNGTPPLETEHAIVQVQLFRE